MRISRLFFAVLLCLVALAAALADQPAATAETDDYYEYFYSVNADTYDSDSDGYDDSVTLEMDVDTTGGYVGVTAEAFLEDDYGFVLATDSAAWTVYGEESESGYVGFTITSGDPGYFTCFLELYDDMDYWEDDWSGSVYLYPLGHGAASTPAPTLWRPPTRTSAPTFVFGGSDGDGMNGGAVAGIVVGALLVVVAGLLWTSRRRRRGSMEARVAERERAPDDRIAKFRAKMERWREEGYDVSELEDLFR
ncbi:MAG: hypothetical protein ACYTAS_20165 [Planctomycetota bacterium]|jgi:hypothetical protein